LHVLEDDDRGRANAELAEHRERYLVRPRSRCDELPEVAAGRLCDVDERSERTRRAQGLARAPEDPSPLGVVLAEPA
jgi:hypothetical protein